MTPGLGCLAIAAVVLLFNQECNAAAPEVDRLYDEISKMQMPASEIVASDGTVLYRVSGDSREYVKLEDIPKNVRNAIIAAEDRRFYQHPGVDLYSLGRILFTNVREGRAAQGGSTITMQLAKRLTSKGEKTFKRKWHDMALAVDVEKKFTKDQVLELYLNQVYFGANAYGVKAAAAAYFNKDLKDLTLSDAAILARCVRRPSDVNPQNNYKKAIENRNVVLHNMYDEGMIDEDELGGALKEQPKIQRKPATRVTILKHPYFVNHVLDVLHRENPDIDLDEGGYRIETTLDEGMQTQAEGEVTRFVRENRGHKITTAAFVLMNPDGEILAEVGGVSFNRNQYNVAAQGHRQPGSSFKPIVYATAFATGKLSSDSDEIPNERVVFPAPPGGIPYSPRNSNGKYGGSVPVRTAFKWSINIPAVHVNDMTGPEVVVQYAHDNFGFVSKLHAVLSLALGTSEVNMLEMAQAYSVFMLNGDRATPYIVRRVVKLPDNVAIVDYGPNIIKNALDSGVASQIDSLLRDVVQSGTGTYADSRVPDARGKTGTTQDNKDAWFCGYSHNLVGIAWIANEQMRGARSARYDPMAHEVYGGTYTVQLWSAIMRDANNRYGDKFMAHQVGDSGDSSDGHKGKGTETKPAIPNPDENGIDQGKALPDGLDPSQNPDQKLPPLPAGADLGGDENGTSTDPSAGAGTPTQEKPKTPDKPKSAPSAKRPDPVGTSNQGSEDAYVEVEVCTASGQRASIYCPETITKKFKRGNEPKRVCSIHKGG